MLYKLKMMVTYSACMAIVMSFGSASDDANYNVDKKSFVDKEKFQQRLELGKARKGMIDQEEENRLAILKELEDEENKSGFSLEKRDSVSNFRKLDPNRKLPNQPKKAGDASDILIGMLRGAHEDVLKICKMAKDNRYGNPVFSDIFDKKVGLTYTTQESHYRRENSFSCSSLDPSKHDLDFSRFKYFYNSLVASHRFSIDNVYKALKSFIADALLSMADAGFDSNEYGLSID